jgi:predicted HTH transcriptional regulator
MMSKVYLRYLRIALAVDIFNKNSDSIDSTALELLNQIAVHHFENNALTVSQCIALKKIASPATLHRKLDELREAGLIEQVFEGKDRRTKYLVPTKLADAYFAKLSKAIASAVKV